MKMKKSGNENSSRDDLSSMLRGWKYDEENNVRRFRTKAGREILQVRLPLGIEQYELNGRPDGLKPEGHESWLDMYREQSEVYGREFVLDDDALEQLVNEGLLFYHRYLLFFQIQEFELCVRDTSRNLRLLEFVNSNAGKEEHVEVLEQYRPYIKGMQVMARALHKVKELSDFRSAIRILRQGQDAVEGLEPLPENEIFEFERSRALVKINDLLQQLERQVPQSLTEKLETKLNKAIEEEDYELAAELRDRLKSVIGQPDASLPDGESL
jgi:hypothetical protein